MKKETLLKVQKNEIGGRKQGGILNYAPAARMFNGYPA